MKNLDKTLWIKRIFMVLMDICIVILTSITALIVRFEFSLSAVPKYYIGVVWSSLPATLVIAIIVFYVFRLYSSLWVYAGVTELLYLAAACIVDTLLNTVTILLNYRDQEYPLPRSWYFIYEHYYWRLCLSAAILIGQSELFLEKKWMRRILRECL